MKLKAAPGNRCPMEGKPREYITDKKAVTVASSPYYLRLLRDGSLVEVSQEAEAMAKKPKKKGGK